VWGSRTVRDYTETAVHAFQRKKCDIFMVCICICVSGQSYGCVVKKKVIYLEELKRGTPDFGPTFNILPYLCILFCL